MHDQQSLAIARRATRLKLFEPVLLRLHGMPFRAHLLDLSATGALAHSERTPCVGDHVLIEGESLCVSGRVVWVRARRFGLRFDVPLADMIVQRVVMGD
ncbi:MAG: PilZ domain-containing protein [Sphingomonadaceae bacterium]|nr:PilZ domain-containing protein [Sphingomonadaceae bacterium]